MNELLGITLLFESLIPIKKEEPITLSVGAVTLLLPEHDLPLDFRESLMVYDMVLATEGQFYIILKELDPYSSWWEYQKMGTSPSDFTYEFFRSQRDSTYVTEIYTEILHAGQKIFLPLTLKKMHLYFSNGLILDYTDRISIFALDDLVEAS